MSHRDKTTPPRANNKTAGGYRPGSSGHGFDRRDFVKLAGLGPAATAGLTHLTARASLPVTAAPAEGPAPAALTDASWPSLRLYDQTSLARIALPLGGIGTGTVSLGGNGNLRDWEIMNRPAKGFIPFWGENGPFFAIFAHRKDRSWCRLLEGPVEFEDYEGSHGSRAPHDNLPRFRNCTFAAAYPLGRVMLSDEDLPFEVHLKAFNPMIPGDPESSGIPVAVLTYEIHNRSNENLDVSICGSLPNFIGMDGWETRRDWKGDRLFFGAHRNRNQFRSSPGLRGIFMTSEGVNPKAEQWGTLALATNSVEEISHRICWPRDRWGSAILDFWDDFAADGKLETRETWETDMPMASLSVQTRVSPGEIGSVTFLLSWHFPNRYSWTPAHDPPGPEDWIGNYYAGSYKHAWDVQVKTLPRLEQLREKTIEFVKVFCDSPLPREVKEAALFNISTLRTQTCFRTPDGRFFGWEGTGDQKGCCHGSCTHVWNYEQATAFLFGDLAMQMREVEFGHATNDVGLMSFRVNLPLTRAQSFGKAAADGQMGCIMKMYRDWQLSGDDQRLRALWPRVRKALEFCWIEGGWDSDRDGVMEGCQHNTMDVEYYGPNPQMGIWYLGALRAAEEMARHLGEEDFAVEVRRLFDHGRRWIDENLFNGEYYIHRVQPPESDNQVAPSLRVGMGATDPARPDFQLGTGCLVDQLVGQFMAHVCGLGSLVKAENASKTLQSILKYNRRAGLHDHFNSMRTFALGAESALLMAGYPENRPANPFPYFTEVMTGFEYTAAVGMLYEGLVEEGLSCIRDIRERYDGKRRSPFDEAECGHHYARAMASWAAIPALTGFHFSGVAKRMAFAPMKGRVFWSNGYAWGDCEMNIETQRAGIQLTVRSGRLSLKEFRLRGYGARTFDETLEIETGGSRTFQVMAGFTKE